VDIAGALIAWFARHRRDLPWRHRSAGAWGVLVSEIMLQQTQVARVVPVWEEWMLRWPAPGDLARESPGEAVRAWGRLGYPRRALRLHAAAAAIVERHHGVVPDHLDELLALPGVGEYTARAVAAFAFGQRHPVVDTNVRRVVARAVAGQADAGPASLRRDHTAVEALLPTEAGPAATFSAAIMELGALVCTARSPDCERCPIAAACAWRIAGYPDYDGPRRTAQARFEGSDRQLRGRVMALLRASELPVPASELQTLDADDERVHRILESLVADGLAVTAADGFTLPR
jgi:A/G-specific adenine glycosylase